jgi:superfamily II DNA or RNA helicase
MNLWPHQRRGVDATLAAIEACQRRVCLTSPTGGGKTKMMGVLLREWLSQGLRALLLTNRRMLLEQISGVMRKAGLAHGIRAAGYYNDPDEWFQISSVQTERSRVLAKKRWELFPADRVLIDEAHLQSAATVRQLLGEYHARGAAYVGVTATPIGLGDLYDVLIQAGVPSELRACGALVMARYFAPDEPDTRNLKKLKIAAGPGEDLSEKAQRKLMGSVNDRGEADERLHQLFGRVVDWYERLNPDRRPGILFAPGVRESIWFAEQFCGAGIPAAHIDGEHIWLDGRLQRSTPERRAQVLEMSRLRKIAVLCNRFVLREGIDAPWLSYGIFATVFGALQSYIQSGGRLLRACPGKLEALIQDHGGNYWRHGSLNEDRVWRLDYTAGRIAGDFEDRMREDPEQQPVRCPKCAMVSKWRGARCPACGYELPRSRISRPVVQLDGALKEIRGDVYKPRRLYTRPNAAELWQKMYHRARSEKWDATFRQAEALFCHEHGAWPDRGLPLFPRDKNLVGRRVRDVPADQLIPNP